MKTMRGHAGRRLDALATKVGERCGLILTQFAGDGAPFNALDEMAKWAASLGFAGVRGQLVAVHPA